GKTSFMNLVFEQLKQDRERVVTNFNPWLFSGTEDLIARFFQDVASKLKLALPVDRTEIADRLEAYGAAAAPLAWIPVAGGPFGRISTALNASAKLARRRGGSDLERRRASLERELL